MPITTPTPSRRGYNNRERDRENGTLNTGVRQLQTGDVEAFNAPDPLWEQSRSESPYVYAHNNPMRFTDPNGMQAVDIGIDVIVGFYKGVYVNTPLGIFNAAVEQGKQFILGPVWYYNQAKELIDGTTAKNIEKTYKKVTSSPGAFAEFGGQTFGTAVLYHGLFGLGAGAGIAGGEATAGNAAKATLATEARTASSGVTKLFRAVEPAEMADIKATGQFRALPGQVEGKYFSTTLEGAEQFAQMSTARYGLQYQIVETSISTSAITPDIVTTVDRGIPTVFVPLDKLPLLSKPK